MKVYIITPGRPNGIKDCTDFGGTTYHRLIQKGVEKENPTQRDRSC